MPKNLFQDMVKVKRMRNEEARASSTPHPSHQPHKPHNTHSLYISREDEIIKEPAEKKVKKEITTKRHSKRRSAPWLVASIALVFLFFALSYLFSEVIINIDPKIQGVVLNENLSATKDANGETLPFDLVVISSEETQAVTTTLEKDMSQKAKGVAVLYNAFSSSPQALNIDTRLEGSNGKMYKTETKITVPGINKDGKPGSVEVKIYGGEAGAEYNSVPIDFKIFGFKGTPKYSKFYGRSKGSIAGGISGKFPFISDDQKTNAVNDMKTILEAKLFRKAKDQIPAGFILFKDAVFLDTDDGVVDYAIAKDKTLPIKLKGTLYGMLFNEEKLTKKIAEENITKYDGSDVVINNIRDLTFSLSNKDNISFADVQSINFNLSGSIKIVWKLDVDALVTNLLGKSKKDFNQILLKYPNIDSAKSTIRPFWKRSFPEMRRRS